MAQTQRTLTNLWSLLADNITQAISPQDLRDGFETLRPRHGQIYVPFGNGALLALPNQGNYYEATASTWSFDSGYEFTMTTNGRLAYTGAQDIMVHAAASISFTSAGNNVVLHMRLGKSGVPSAVSEAQRKVGTGTDVGSTALHWVTPMSTGDYLSLWFRNESSTAGVTLQVANLQLMSMPM